MGFNDLGIISCITLREVFDCAPKMSDLPQRSIITIHELVCVHTLNNLFSLFFAAPCIVFHVGFNLALVGDVDGFRLLN